MSHAETSKPSKPHAPGMSRWSLQTLGAFRFFADGVELTPPSLQKARALLAYLIWHRGTELSRERLVELFWPDAEPARGRSNLNTALWSIRRMLRAIDADSNAALAANKTRAIWLAQTSLDIREFEQNATAQDPDQHRRALELYQGEFLDGDYSDWSIAIREQMSRIYETLLSEAVSAGSDIVSAQRLIDRGNLDEAPYDLKKKAESRNPSCVAERCSSPLISVAAIDRFPRSM
jgi:DNA-binding SARP family transcriptional activator